MADSSSILVVDDEADSLSVLASILTGEGYQVRTADSGGLALKSVAAWLPELILLDVRMPDLDGFDVCQRLKASDESRRVPVIFITAADEVDERVKGLAAGAVDYITKPFHREELLARVRTHLELARLRTQENALSKQKMESLISLTRGISHDFSNMLGAILAQAETAEANLSERLPAGDEVRRIKAVALRASEVVRQLMIYSGQQEAELEPLDLSELMEQMSDLLKASVSKKCALHFDLDRGLPPVAGNAAQLSQLAMNLVINASQAIGEQGGSIHVRTSQGPQEDRIRLEVSDTGCGMTEHDRARIFDPFFTTKPDGHGLGLAVVHGIAHSHNAPINVASTPGKGTTFEVLFRRAGESPAVASASDAESRIEAVTGTVLLVEDHDELRLAIATELQRSGISVITAADGPGAIEVFRDRVDDIAIAVLDMSLPGLSGLEVFRQMRAINPDVRVILTSAYDLKSMRAELDEGIAGVLQKPYRIADLIRELQLASG
jgi:two-component system cell cycle sensor histidine kinase/response regulator CckA